MLWVTHQNEVGMQKFIALDDTVCSSPFLATLLTLFFFKKKFSLLVGLLYPRKESSNLWSMINVNCQNKYRHGTSSGSRGVSMVTMKIPFESLLGMSKKLLLSRYYWYTEHEMWASYLIIKIANNRTVWQLWRCLCAKYHIPMHPGHMTSFA